jgi:hypothetical protein
MFAALTLGVFPFTQFRSRLLQELVPLGLAQIERCTNGGWQTLAGASGPAFTDEDECVTYAIHHPVSLAVVASSSPFSGTTEF